MAKFPTDVAPCTVTGTAISSEGEPLPGARIRFEPSQQAVVTGSGFIVDLDPFEVIADADGSYSAQIIPSDDPDTSKAWTWRVSLLHDAATAVKDAKILGTAVTIPADTPSIELANCPGMGIADGGTTTPPTGVTYVPTTLIGKPNGVAGLDAGGKVPATQLPAVTSNVEVSDDDGNQLAQRGDGLYVPAVDLSGWAQQSWVTDQVTTAIGGVTAASVGAVPQPSGLAAGQVLGYNGANVIGMTIDAAGGVAGSTIPGGVRFSMGGRSMFLCSAANDPASMAVDGDVWIAT